MSALLQTLATYVPAPVVRRLATHAGETIPELERFVGAVMFADVSGFTALAEQLALDGAAGTEELTRRLNAFFGALIATITEHGGEVVKFAGDGLLASWAADGDLTAATAQATACALAAQAVLGAATDVQLALRIGVGAGEITTMIVGGVYNRWELLVGGPPLAQVRLGQRHAAPGEVVVSAEGWALIAAVSQGQALPSGDVAVTAVAAPPRPAVVARPLPESAEPLLRGYIPGAILARLAAGQTGWLAELRRLSILFVNIPDLDGTAPDALAQAQTVMQTLQRSVYRYEGSINKLSVGDQGVTLLAALGLPPLAHEDDAVRAVQAAMTVVAALQQLGLRATVGVATGRVFCGAIGSAERREYSMIGDVVNVAARLMQAAAQAGVTAVWCDSATFQSAQSQLSFEALPAVTVKGKADPLPVFSPQGRARAVARGTAPSLVGRLAEQGRITASLAALQHLQVSSVLVIEGEAGIGKSRLIEATQRQAEGLRLGVFVGAGDAVEQSTAYFSWRAVFSQLFDLDVLIDQEARRRHMLDLLELEPELLALAPLLNVVLPLDLPENRLTAQLTGEIRAERTRDLLLQALQVSVARSAKVLIIEDAHWLDSASWALLEQVIQGVAPLLVVLATRPLPVPAPAEYARILASARTERLVLSSLTPAETAHLIAQRLGVEQVPESIAELVADKAQGNPFFTEELTYALRDAGVVQVVGDQAVAAAARALAEVLLPDTVQGVITSRIDRLTAAQQLTLKVASVIGRVFLFRTLHAIHPIDTERPRIASDLDMLASLDLTPLELARPRAALHF